MSNNILKNGTISIVFGFAIVALQYVLKSDYFMCFLKQNLITLLIVLMSINAATLGIITTRLRDILDKINQKEAFENAKKQMLLSLKEQITLIVFICCIFNCAIF
ncbi:hypothetical protein [Helicobacter cetorum]|uniref:hypothetical protein n=1 Tax=Helicobacter cetorum TaxID=138563 RepID=UPI000CF0B96D|nr:hypothetical protein [Helicobacter cetorum]